MVFYEGNGIPLVIIIGRKRFLVVTQVSPVAIVYGIAHTVAELEVESGAGGFVRYIPFAVAHPLTDFVSTVPIFANAEGWLGISVVFCYEVGIEALHHIVAESRISYIFEQELQISLDTFLHIGT